MNNLEMTEKFEDMLEDSLKTLHTGETVRGIITAITDAEIYLDLGTKVTGVIAYDQVTDDSNVKLRDMFKVGDAFLNMIKSTYRWTWSVTKKEAKYIKGETLDKIFDVNKLKKDSQALDEKLKENT